MTTFFNDKNDAPFLAILACSQLSHCVQCPIQSTFGIREIPRQANRSLTLALSLDRKPLPLLLEVTFACPATNPEGHNGRKT